MNDISPELERMALDALKEEPIPWADALALLNDSTEETTTMAMIYAYIFSAGILVGAVAVWLGIVIGLHMRQVASMVVEDERRQLL